LRVINASALSFIMMAIEQHSDLQIIEADGEYTTSAKADGGYLQLGGGQRYSALLRAKTAGELATIKRSQFWVRLENRDRPSSTGAYALLRYVGVDEDRNQGKGPGEQETQQPHLPLPAKSPVELPIDRAVYNTWMEGKLHPLPRSVGATRFPRNEEVNRTIVIQVNQQVRNGGLLTNGSVEGNLVWA
jgi:FtsP/CotA-like multicopper oxidase with cupredoxin domain